MTIHAIVFLNKTEEVLKWRDTTFVPKIKYLALKPAL